MMQKLAVALLFLAPVAIAGPDPSAPSGVHLGIMIEGERDEWREWLDMWAGDDGWTCSSSLHEDVFVLTVIEAQQFDELVLETYIRGGPTLQATATLDVPAVLYGESVSGCREFAVLGTSIEDAASYRVDHFDRNDVFCTALCD